MPTDDNELLARARAAGQVTEHDSEHYLDIDAAAAYLGKAPSTVWMYLKRYGFDTYRFPLHGKRAFLRRSDLDRLRSLPPEPRKKDDAA